MGLINLRYINALLAESTFWPEWDTKYLAKGDSKGSGLRWEDRGRWEDCWVDCQAGCCFWSCPSWCTWYFKCLAGNCQRKLVLPGKCVQSSPHPSVALSRWSRCWGKSPFLDLRNENNSFSKENCRHLCGAFHRLVQTGQAVHWTGETWQLAGDSRQAGRQLLTQVRGDVTETCCKTS